LLLQDNAASGALKSVPWSSLPSGGGGGMSIGGAVTSGTPGSVLFIDGSSNLSQNNTNFFWDDTNKYLKIGSSGTQAVVYLNTLPALYQIPNASGSNWFEGNAGNTTLTGYLNFGTGDKCMNVITSGFQNTAIGANSLLNATTANNNIGFGTQALWLTQTDANNVAVGYNTLGTLGASGVGAGNNVNNVAIGSGALNNMYQGAGNVAVGPGGLSNLTGSTINHYQNTVIGQAAGNSLGLAGTGVNTTALIGANCGAHLIGGTGNSWIGGYQGPSASPNNTIVLSDGSGNYLTDFSLTNFQIWSMGAGYGVYSAGLHIYNKQDSPGVVTNYERAILDWNPTANIFRIGSQAGGTGTVRLIAYDAFSKAGAPAAGDLPAGTCAFIDDTTNNQTWLVFNKAGTIRKVQLT